MHLCGGRVLAFHPGGGSGLFYVCGSPAQRPPHPTAGCAFCENMLSHHLPAGPGAVKSVCPWQSLSPQELIFSLGAGSDLRKREQHPTEFLGGPEAAPGWSPGEWPAPLCPQDRAPFGWVPRGFPSPLLVRLAVRVSCFPGTDQQCLVSMNLGKRVRYGLGGPHSPPL